MLPAFLLLVTALAGNEQAPSFVPVFDCYTENPTWGAPLSGKFVDHGGAILAYRSDKDIRPRETREDGAVWLDGAELAAKFANATEVGRVDVSLVTAKALLVEAAAKGKLEHQAGRAIDAGLRSCHAYVADAAHARYRDVDLGTDGGASDRRVVNTAPEAAELIGWLRDIGVAF
ncbi:MAG TPA: hypothetical protein VFB32_06240 [Rudaea sp.]|nr:hypothetical protein [Rudaea sp.]